MMETHTFTIIGRPMSTTNSQIIVDIPIKGGAGKKRKAVLKSKEARKWLQDALPQIRTQRRGRPTIEGPVEVEIDVHRSTNSGDVDNYVKGCLDALQEAGVFLNDRQVMKITAEKFTDPRNPRYEVRVKLREHQGTLMPLQDRPEKKKGADLGTMVARALGTEPWPADKIPDIFRTQAERDGEQ